MCWTVSGQAVRRAEGFVRRPMRDDCCFQPVQEECYLEELNAKHCRWPFECLGGSLSVTDCEVNHLGQEGQIKFLTTVLPGI